MKQEFSIWNLDDGSFDWEDDDNGWETEKWSEEE